MMSLPNPATMSRKTGGFTLVEMLVVIVVIGILAAIAVPIFLSQSDKANDAALQSDLANAARMLQVAEASGETLPGSLPAGQVTDLGAAGTITPAATLTVSGSGATLCVEGTSDSGDVYSADVANGLRNYDCSGNANGIAPLVLSYADTSFTSGSNNEALTATISGNTGTTTYSVSGTLPDGVTFDETTGTFTGPADSAWNFTATQISGGDYHTCAVTTTGGAKCWGRNGYGGLGDGTTTDSSTPVDVSGLTSGVASIDAGFSHTCAVTTTGGAKCWGRNDDGQLGDGTSGTDRLTPVDVSGLTSGVASISVGGSHTCAVTTSGGAKCWGLNNDGQLGDGAFTNRSTPVDVSGLTSGVASISVGFRHTCAVTTTGGVKCWGRNDDGQLGDGTSGTDRLTPVDVSGLTSGVASISAGSGGNHTCALTTTGGAKCWGRNNYGGLGDGTTTNSSTPVDVSGLTSGVASISAGYGHTCAVTTTGGAKCWGDNFRGGLGDGSTTDRSTPVDVDGLTSGVASINAGGHTCAVTTTGGAKCWGDNNFGQLGDGTTTNSSTPVDVDGFEPQPGFPATVDVTVTDDSGSTTESVTLSVD